MNRMDWEKQIYASNMNPTARIVAVVIGSFGNWTKDKTVEPGTKKVAEMAGVTRDTVDTYITAMVEQGWLKPIGTGQYNTTIYELCEVVADTTGNLARVKRKMNPKSTAKLRKGKPPLVADTTGNQVETDEDDIKRVEETMRRVVADTTGLVAESSGGQLPNAEALVADSTGTNLEEPKEKNLREHKTSESPVADAPVSSLNEELEVKKDAKRLRFLNPLEKKEVEGLCKTYGVEGQTSLIVERLETQRPNRSLTFSERVRGVMTDIGIEGVNTEW